MPEALLISVFENVRRHPWWRARAALALALLRRHGVPPPAAVLDVGCGWGTNLAALEQAGYQVAGLDISRQVLEQIDRPDRRLIEADLTQPLPPHTELAEALLGLDVIEHIDDDRGALRRMAELLRPGGVAVISVPALPELWSEFDQIQGHRRRYVPESLRAAFEGTGLRVRTIFWWGAWMVPILRRMRQHSEGNDRAPRTYADYLRLPRWPGPLLMQVAFAMEKPFALRGALPTGTSLLAVAVRE